jgi:glyoxylase-like metal-dependent hydrolase (beta-lactamase superfamily II)
VSFNKIQERIYRVTGPDMTDRRDCFSYLLDLGEPVLIDCGLGFGFQQTLLNIKEAGFSPAVIKHLILTHCHVDHVGAAALFRAHLGTSLTMHELDARIVGRGDQLRTAAFCFEIEFARLPIDNILTGEKQTLAFGDFELVCLHTPGHTPGSISLYIDMEGMRIAFVQDIGAPLLADFECDPEAWNKSMKKLLALDADILCDGHSGVYSSKRNVRRYLQTCISSQKKHGHDFQF